MGATSEDAACRDALVSHPVHARAVKVSTLFPENSHIMKTNNLIKILPVLICISQISELLVLIEDEYY